MEIPAFIIRARREALGVTQGELARRAGISRETLNAIERGHVRRPHRWTIRGLARALGLTVTDIANLFTEDD